MSTYQKLNFLAAAGLSCVLAALFFSGPAMAKSKKQSIDMAPCKVEVRAAGDARPGETWAKEAMEKKWQKEVKGRFGEAFTVLANAKDIRSRCYPGPLNTTRCEMIARPCEVRF
jgi:hypothetical protein